MTTPDLPLTGTCHHCGADEGQPCAADCPVRLRVRRHATGRTDQVTIRSYFRGARRWYAPWLFRYPMTFAHSGGTPADCARRFDQFVTELRQDARARGFVDGSVTWVTVRDYWTGAPDEDLNFIWAAHTPVMVRRLTIGPDLAVTDTGGIAREVR